MNLLFTICGRAGSKGLKNKNLKNFLGFPLVYYSLAAIDLYRARYAPAGRTDVCLNTDSPDLTALVARQTAVPVFPIARSAALGGDRVAKMEVIKDCLFRTEERFGTGYDMVVDLDITSPLRTVDHIRQAVEEKAARPDVDVVFSVTESRRNPYFNMVKREGDYYTKVIPSEFTARQQAPEICDMNASIYAYSPAFLRQNTSNRLFDGRCSAVKMPDTAVLDIDGERDFELMEVIAGYLLPRDLGLSEIRDHIPSL